MGFSIPGIGLLFCALCGLSIIPRSLTQPGYLVRVRTGAYENPDHRAASGRCCDGVADGTRCTDVCDNQITFCISSTCYTSEVIEDDTITSFGFRGLPYPMNFTGSGPWSGNVQLTITINDVDSSVTHDSVDTISVMLSRRPDPYGWIVNTWSDPIEENRQHYGIHRNAYVLLSFSVWCNPYYYGGDCTRYCEFTDSSLGHYYCDFLTGSKNCLDGWRDPSNNCTTAVCSGSCDDEGGFCTQPGGTCQCRANYYGSSCSTYCERTDSSLGHYDCDSTGSKICLSGWTDSYNNCLSRTASASVPVSVSVGVVALLALLVIITS